MLAHALLIVAAVGFTLFGFRVGSWWTKRQSANTVPVPRPAPQPAPAPPRQEWSQRVLRKAMRETTTLTDLMEERRARKERTL